MLSVARSLSFLAFVRAHRTRGASVKFGIFYHLQVPQPWGPDTEDDVIQNSLDQVELADQVMFVTQAGRNKHEHICEALELFATEVMPEFHANIPAHEEWKTAVLNGDIILEDLHAEQYTQKYSNKPASSWEKLPPERTGSRVPNSNETKGSRWNCYRSTRTTRSWCKERDPLGSSH
jgi:hypothetical protein